MAGRGRIAIVAAAIAIFVVAGGALIHANQGKGGTDVTFRLAVVGASSMSPSTVDAHLNDMVTIDITSDTTGEVHLHGYDIAFDCTAGQRTSHTFKADRSGRFDIEWESTGAPLGTLVVA